MVAIVIGGAFFGDNLSFISDTTIAATKTQGCEMRDKFKVNSLIVMPAAILLLIYYVFAGIQIQAPAQVTPVEWDKSISLSDRIGNSFGRNKCDGCSISGASHFRYYWDRNFRFRLFRLVCCHGKRNHRMGELIIITLLAGGMLEMIRYNGGIDFIINKLTMQSKLQTCGELSIAGLVCLANLCTANNTIAVITIGPIARKIAEKFDIDRRKSASILDTFSCFIQGIIPYGAQMLMAAG